MKKALFYILLFLFTSSTYLNAQIEYKGSPHNFGKKSLNEIPFVSLPKQDPQEIEKLLTQNQGKKKQLIGKVFDVDYSTSSIGKWENVDGAKIWRLGIGSEGAEEIGLMFENFNLEEGVKLFIYPENKQYYIGAFTHLNNKRSGKLPVRGVGGENIIVELQVPDYASIPEFSITEVRHNYIAVSPKKKLSGSCHIDINCTEGQEWQIEKRAVVKFTYSEDGRNYSCTGSLINNTNFDGIPYILSANHCISNSTIAETAVFYFNHEKATCSSLLNKNAKTIASSIFRATGPLGALDFSLLELSEVPPVHYEAYYAGWSRNPLPTDRTVGIHHPVGDVKKISIDTSGPATLEIPPIGWPDDSASHWKVYWDLGVTEGGSSGSPLFDSNHRIIGDLSGGDASCEHPENPDYFTKFDLSWNKYPGKTTSLKPWLDPRDIDPLFIDGLTPNDEAADLRLDEIVYPNGAFRFSNSLSPVIVVNNGGMETITQFDINISINLLPVRTDSWTGELKSQSSQIIKLNQLEISPNDTLLKITLTTNAKGDYKENNTREIALEYTTGDLVNLKFEGASENTLVAWTLNNSKGETLYRKTDNTKLMVDSYPFILPPGCYYLLLQPVAIDQPQSVELYNETDQETIATGLIDNVSSKKAWGNSNLTRFCINPEATATADVFNDQYEVVKNFAHDYIGLKVNYGYLKKIDLYTVNGQHLQSWTDVKGKLNIPLHGYEQGVYVVKIYGSRFQSTEKVLLVKP